MSKAWKSWQGKSSSSGNPSPEFAPSFRSSAVPQFRVDTARNVSFRKSNSPFAARRLRCVLTGPRVRLRPKASYFPGLRLRFRQRAAFSAIRFREWDDLAVFCPARSRGCLVRPFFPPSARMGRPLASQRANPRSRVAGFVAVSIILNGCPPGNSLETSSLHQKTDFRSQNRQSQPSNLNPHKTYGIQSYS